MPLVVPGLQNKAGDDKTSKWMNELMGKKLGDQSNETTFAKKNLPEKHRVIEHDGLKTADHVADRLNVHLGPDGTVKEVYHG